MSSVSSSAWSRIIDRISSGDISGAVRVATAAIPAIWSSGPDSVRPSTDSRDDRDRRHLAIDDFSSGRSLVRIRNDVPRRRGDLMRSVRRRSPSSPATPERLGPERLVVGYVRPVCDADQSTGETRFDLVVDQVFRPRRLESIKAGIASIMKTTRDQGDFDEIFRRNGIEVPDRAVEDSENIDPIAAKNRRDDSYKAEQAKIDNDRKNAIEALDEDRERKQARDASRIQEATTKAETKQAEAKRKFDLELNSADVATAVDTVDTLTNRIATLQDQPQNGRDRRSN